MDARLAVRRKNNFREEEQALLATLNNLEKVSLHEVQILHIYDVFNATSADLATLKSAVICDERVDELLESEFFQRILKKGQSENCKVLGVEPLPGQYDQRADAAEQLLRLLHPDSSASIYSGQMYVMSPAPDTSAINQIRDFLINPIESREKDFSVLQAPNHGSPEALKTYPDFLQLDSAGLSELLKERGMAMSLEDLLLIQNYFHDEGRCPTEVELAVLDTYWSDHCRHTTFHTELTDINNNIPDTDPLHTEIDKALMLWQELRISNGRKDKPKTLMELGTIAARELRRTGKLKDQELSEEINACSVHTTVSTPTGKQEPWLLMFKNETHNHPTEIEPFGGAATCLGGAIRDPLSGRSWVYQALRLSGAGDITVARENTLAGKLPQADISTRATAGYSSYGNQIGLATTTVREIVHPGYVAKRMELGAVVAAAPQANVRRLTPENGDAVIILGGRTGRDGIGGATGSSKAHDSQSLKRSGAEVQKGNPVNERKIQRLFRDPKVSQMIIRCNDFGAGGVAVAVGELAESLDIYLDRVPLKYAGLNAREIAISESQERMAVVVRNSDTETFIRAARRENLEATVLATVRDTGRLRMFLGEEKVLDLARCFVDTNGAKRHQAVKIQSNPSAAGKETRETTSILESLARTQTGSQEGMVEQFDSTVGRSTVLMPYGGRKQKTAEAVSVQTLPVEGGTSTASIITYGYSTDLADSSPFLMGAYSVVEALSRLTAAGANPREAWLTVQEYFQRLDDDPSNWGVVTQALLGLLEAQIAFEVAAIGGKDSMSGSFGDELHVPPTLVSFAVATLCSQQVLSATLPQTPTELYYLPHIPLPSGSPDYTQLKENFQAFSTLHAQGIIKSACAILPGGLASTVVNMCLGNEIGFTACSNADRELKQICVNGAATQASTGYAYEAQALGGLVFAVPDGTKFPETTNMIKLGKASAFYTQIDFGMESFTVRQALDALEHGYSQVFALNVTEAEPLPDFALTLPESNPKPTAETSSEPKNDSGKSVSKRPELSVENLPPALHSPASLQITEPNRVQRAVCIPHVLLPVFPGTNSEYDMAEAFRQAGATTEFHVIRNLNSKMLETDTQEFIAKLYDKPTRILAFSGGFSAGDEPDGSAKFMAAFLRTGAVSTAIKDFTSRNGLVLGVCNGFQALIKSGFLPYGDPDCLRANSPTLARNRQLRHVSRIATTRVSTTACSSPWLSSFVPGQIHKIPVSHGEGRFVVDQDTARELFKNGQVAFQYVGFDKIPTMAAPENPNGSNYAIEGIISPDGRILGKMGHPERYREGLMQNIPDIETQDIFANAVKYCSAHSY